MNDAGPEMVFRPGALMTGTTNLSAGPLCPRPVAELASSWLTHPMPFSQVHGHEGVWHWPSNDYHPDVPTPVRDLASRDNTTRFCWVQIGNRMLYSIDPVLGITAPADYQAVLLVLTATNPGTQ